MPYLLAIILLIAFAVPAHSSANINKNMDLCKAATQVTEGRYAIPSNLLRAISLTETGRWIADEKANIAWPWTVSSGGAGEYFQTKTEAIRHVRSLQEQGITNIDVGCMQINLRYHPEAFKDLNEAFDPYRNANYAGSFLSKLFGEEKSWTAAAGRYHSSDTTKNMYYREKVLSFWNYANTESHEERQQIAQEKRPEVYVPRQDVQRMALLNDSFRKRLSNQREALERADEISSKLTQYRNMRTGSVNRAVQGALREQKAKKLLSGGPAGQERLSDGDFAKRRSLQLQRWRTTVANPELLAQNNRTTQPKTLLD